MVTECSFVDALENTPRTLPKGSRDPRSLRVLCNFRLRMRIPKGTPKRSHPVAMLLPYYCTTTKKTNAGGKLDMRRTYFRTGPLPVRHVTEITSGPKAPIGRILRNFRLRIRRTYFQTRHVTNVASGHVSSGHMTSGHVPPHDPPQIIICPWPYTTQVLLKC